MKHAKKGTAIILIALILSAVLSLTSGASNNKRASDTKGHWCETRINSWMDDGIINGYPDGSFKPDGTITRAEFIKTVNNAFGFKSGKAISFSDVKSTDWYYNDIRIAYNIGYINGYVDGTMKPNAPITREEVAKIIAVLLELEEYASGSYSFADYSSIDSWARGYVGAVLRYGIMNGYSGNEFRPRYKMTRAECVQSLWNARDKKNNPSGNDYTVNDEEYTPSKQATVKNLYIAYQGDVLVKNVYVKGDIIISTNMKNRTLTLNNVTCDGKIEMDYGNLALENSSINKLTYSGTTAEPSVVLTGSSTIGSMYVERSVTIDQTGLSSAAKGIEDLHISGRSSSVATTLYGNFSKITTGTDDQTINLAKGRIAKLIIENEDTHVVLAAGTTLESVEVYGRSTIDGPGTVANALVESRYVTMQRKPTKLSGTRTPSYTDDYKLTFVIKDRSSGKVIQGATVVLDGFVATGTTDSKGSVTFEKVTDKDISYTVTKTGYYTFEGDIDINGANKVVDNITLLPKGDYYVDVTVTDAATKKAIKGAVGVISVNGQKDNTSTKSTVSGVIRFESLGNSSYTYSVSAPGYVTTSGTFTVNGKNGTAAIALPMTKISITVKPAAKPTAQNIAAYTIKAYSLTDSKYHDFKVTNGTYTAEGYVAGSSYDFTVTADGYMPQTQKIKILDDKSGTNVVIYVSSNQTFTYVVTVTDGTSGIEGVTATLSNDGGSFSAKTNSSGQAIITNVPEATNYSLSLTKTGFVNRKIDGIKVDETHTSYAELIVPVRTVGLTVKHGSAAVSGMDITLKVPGSDTVYSGKTDSSGKVSISGVPDGTYDLIGKHTSYELDEKIVIGPTNYTGITLQASEVKVRLTLYLTQIAGGSNNPPVADAIVTLTRTGYEDIGPGQTNNDGAVVFTVPIGEWEVSVEDYDVITSSVTVVAGMTSVSIIVSPK